MQTEHPTQRHRLMVKERATTSFQSHNGDFATDKLAMEEGERLCVEGNVVEFEVWSLSGHYLRSVGITRAEPQP